MSDVTAGKIGRETVHVIAEGIAGIGSVREDVAAVLAPDAEYRVREIVQEAVKFMRHGKRRHMTTDDVDAALRLRNVEPLYGIAHSDSFRFCRVPGGVHGGDVFYVEDREIDLAELIAKPLPPIPLAPSLKGHWLAIEGVQPAIAQNDLGEDDEDGTKEGPSSSKKRQRPTVDKEVKPMVKHVLSREMQLYYDQIVKTVRSDNQAALDLAIENVSQETGLQHLLPYFTLFVHDEVMAQMSEKRNLALLMACMRFVRGLLGNDHLNIEPYLHQLLPPVLTCLVGKRLSSKPTEDHWALRDFTASVVGFICARHGRAYTSLQTRITKTLVSALLDQSRPLTTHYGAIMGLSSMGVHVLEVILLPNLEAYINVLEEEARRNTDVHPIRKKEIAKVYGAIMAATGIYAHQAGVADRAAQGDGDPAQEATSDARKSVRQNIQSQYESMYEEFGDALVPSFPSEAEAGNLLSVTI